jgi:hypothetical protein
MANTHQDAGHDAGQEQLGDRHIAATPKMMKPMDGGMTGAMMPPAAISPAERFTL